MNIALSFSLEFVITFDFMIIMMMIASFDSCKSRIEHEIKAERKSCQTILKHKKGIQSTTNLTIKFISGKI
jgi:hypothetical protein